MKDSDNSYRLKMRSSSRRPEPRVEETVVYHWGRILGVLVCLLLIAFLVFWFLSASPGSSGGAPKSASPGQLQGEDVGSSVSGTIQRSPADQPVPEVANASAAPFDSEKNATESEYEPSAPTTPDQPDQISAAGTESEPAVTEQTGPASTTAEATPSPSHEENSTQAVEPSVPEAIAQPASTPPASVIEDPTNQPAPTDDLPSETTASGPGNIGTADLEIASEHLARAQLTLKLENKEPTAALPAHVRLGSQEVIRVYFFNELQGLKGQVVYHDWYLNGERVARVDIEPYLDTMRASSGKFVNRNMLGEWRVEAVTAQGERLGTGSFTVSK